jgi:4-aminobutyrate aminotransferase
MVGAEIVENSISKESSPQKRNAVIEKSFELGLILQGCGPNTVRFAPPLTVNKEEIQVGMDIFEEAVSVVVKEAAGS